MKWMHPEAGEVEVNPQTAEDEAALEAMGLTRCESDESWDASKAILDQAQATNTVNDFVAGRRKPGRQRKG